MIFALWNMTLGQREQYKIRTVEYIYFERRNILIFCNSEIHHGIDVENNLEEDNFQKCSKLSEANNIKLELVLEGISMRYDACL